MYILWISRSFSVDKPVNNWTYTHISFGVCGTFPVNTYPSHGFILRLIRGKSDNVRAIGHFKKPCNIGHILIILFLIG